MDDCVSAQAVENNKEQKQVDNVSTQAVINNKQQQQQEGNKVYKTRIIHRHKQYP